MKELEAKGDAAMKRGFYKAAYNHYSTASVNPKADRTDRLRLNKKMMVCDNRNAR